MQKKKYKNFCTKVKPSELITVNTGNNSDTIQIIAEPNGKETNLTFRLSENIIIEKLQEIKDG